jgi:putative addiction module component (TIGR02574 family)
MRLRVDAACATLVRVTIEAMIEQALRLSVEDRTELVARLLESLDETAPTDPGHEAAWTEVIDRRVQDLQEGRVELIDGSVTMARAREAVAAARRR